MNRKRIIILSAAIIAVSAIIYIVWASNNIALIQTFIPEKIAVFRNVRMSGVEGADSWELQAEEGWTSRNKRDTILENVSGARIERNGRVLIKELSARRLRISNRKDIEIMKQADEEKNGRQYLDALIDFNAVSNKRAKKDFATLTADKIDFNPDSKKAVIQGNAEILKGKLRIRSGKMVLDLDKDMATFEGRSNFSNDGSKLSSNSAVALFDRDTIDMSGSVEVIQKNKTASSDSAVYDDDARTIVLSSNVRAVIKKLQNIVKQKSAAKVKGAEAKQALQETTMIDCNKLMLSTLNGDCTASGNVLVTQKEKEAKADKAVYSEDTEKIILTGNVYMKQKDNWVKADKVIISVDKETFQASGSVETTFKVKKGAKRSY